MIARVVVITAALSFQSAQGAEWDSTAIFRVDGAVSELLAGPGGHR